MNQGLNYLLESARNQFLRGELKNSLSTLEIALKMSPHAPEVWNNKGIILMELHEFHQAIDCFNKAYGLNKKYVDALFNLGIAYYQQKKFLESIKTYDRAIAINNKIAHFHCNKAISLYALKKYENALHALQIAINLNPNYKEAWYNKGLCLFELNKFSESNDSYIEALKIDSKFADAHYNRGVCLSRMRLHEEAIGSFQNTISIDQKYLNAYINNIHSCRKLMHYGVALQLTEQALTLNPQEKFLLGSYLHTKMLLCDWQGLDILYSQVLQGLRNNQKVAEPFGFQGICTSEADLQKCAQIMADDHFPPLTPVINKEVVYDNPKIRIGYLCGEFRNQATSILMTGVYEGHDKSRFEIFAFDNGWDDGSELRHRMQEAFSQIIDITTLTDEAAAKLIAEMKIDILVNLNGYFGDGRQNIFAHRAAPIQVNYLGFPGTMGAPYMDYLIADQTVIPPDQQEFYTEKVVYLPHCYQANDSKRKIADHQFTRQELGLPEAGFVFCCFNNNYKITPQTFDSWMRILSAVEGSVLWLLEDNANAAKNLRNEAIMRGIAAERLIFAPRMSLPEHLARHRQADLFLDTWPYNAHTTASDALWAGLPLLTCYGTTFAGRVAASLLKAIDLPELITYTPEQYETLAVELALNPNKLGQIKTKLADHRTTTSLFDTAGFTKDLEKVYLQMYAGGGE